ncbi:MAG: glutamate 5-kinase, partial [Candidatus Sericytochromatia bacterium]
RVRFAPTPPAPAPRAGGAGADRGPGGRPTTVAAARIATSCGIPMVLLTGARPELVIESLKGAPVGTTFAPGPNRLEGRKRWLAFGGKVEGTLTLDEGATRAVAT